MDVKEIARELGVRYVLEGSVRKAGGRVRVTGQLIDAESGIHLWAERYDRDYADIFAIQDELTQAVVGAIEPELLAVEGRRVADRPTGALDAYECCVRGMWHLYQTTAEDLARAVDWHRQATSLDPRSSRAHMGLARTLYARCLHGFSDDIARDRADLEAAAGLAVALDDRDPYCHYAMFLAHLHALRHGPALAEAQRAIDLSPNFALAHVALGWVRVFIGHFVEALEPLHVALRLSQHDPMAYLFFSRLAQAHYHLGNYEEGAQHSARALALRRPHFIMAIHLASLGRLGATEAAHALLPEVAAAQPADTTLYWQVAFPYADPAHRAALAEGLRLAGLEDPAFA